MDVIPVGTIMSWGGNDLSTLPKFWLHCDGSALADAEYPALSTALDGGFGRPVGTSTFNLPDLRGCFLRGVSGDSKRDPDAADRIALKTGGHTGNDVGTLQLDAFESHTHPLSQIGFYSKGDYQAAFMGGGSWATGASGGRETRPVNVNIYYIIYAGPGKE